MKIFLNTLLAVSLLGTLGFANSQYRQIVSSENQSIKEELNIIKEEQKPAQTAINTDPEILDNDTFNKAKNLLKQRYPIFAGTCAETEITYQLVKNPEWKLEDITPAGTLGTNKTYYLYDIKSKNDSNIIECFYDENKHRLETALSVWKDPNSYSLYLNLFKAKKALFNDIKSSCKNCTGGKHEIFSKSDKKACTYTLTSAPLDSEPKSLFTTLNRYQKCKDKYYKVGVKDNTILGLYEGKEFFNLDFSYCPQDKENQKILYYSAVDLTKNQASSFRIRTMPLVFKQIKTWNIDNYLPSPVKERCNNIPTKIFEALSYYPDF